ncbi:MAG: 16S rRNA (adenine(1518)-N(6)/adenine(1519)-N(6))-dimethyltransferase RsmA [Candidatus Saccharimonadales bacterium]
MSNEPKKSLGQHWLYDETVLGQICDSAAVSKDDMVLEIGPGLGTLTKLLVSRAREVVAVEYDPILAASLPAKFKGGNLQVIHQDILSFDLTSLPAGYKVVANIPYYLTSNLIRVLTESTNPFSMAAILIQKEVAERVVASPGQMSILSVSAQFYCEVSLGPKVGRELFTPPPKVDSQVLNLRYRSQPLFEDVDVKQFFRLVKAGFSQKRKTLVNSLSAGLNIDKDQTRSMLETAGIANNTRAQALSLENWHDLYKSLIK